MTTKVSRRLFPRTCGHLSVPWLPFGALEPSRALGSWCEDLDGAMTGDHSSSIVDVIVVGIHESEGGTWIERYMIQGEDAQAGVCSIL